MPLTVYTPIVYGDHPGTIGGFAKTGGFTLDISNNSPTGETLVGDSDVLTGFAAGGNNTLTLRNGNQGTTVGDALTVNGFAHAGHNDVQALAFNNAWAAGDAVDMGGFAQGGYNTVRAQAGFGGGAYGDALTMSDFARGGHNTVTGANGHGMIELYGDAGTMSGFASGGDNTLQGSLNNPTIMYGDAITLSGFAQGGGNTLIGSPVQGRPFPFSVINTMYGDGHDLLDFASGGGNTLISGQGANDVMWGDAAVVSPFAHTRANTFVFSPQNGNDVIMDFHPGRDHVDLQGFGFTSFQQLEQDFHQTASGLDIVFDASNDVVLSGISQSQVSAGDFVFS